MREETIKMADNEFFPLCNIPEINKAFCADLEKGIRAMVDDPEIAELLVPKVPFFAKRCLVMDHYYQVLVGSVVKQIYIYIYTGII